MPFVIFAETGQADLDQKAFKLAQITGFDYLIRRTAMRGFTYAAAAEAGIPALLMERGPGHLGRAGMWSYW